MTTHPQTLTWRKSSFSGGNGANCVEVAETETDVQVRNSKRPGEGSIGFTRSELSAWIAGCKAGEFDNLT